MKNREFAGKLFKSSKNLLGMLIPSLGLRERTEQILVARYVKGLCVWDVAEEMGITYESAMNSLCKARREMLYTMETDFDILPADTQKLIKKLLD